MMEKLDLKAKFKNLYSPPSDEPVFADVPPMNCLMVDGEGDPNTSQAFQDAIQALYGVSYTMKFMLKKASDPVDYAVMALEGLWWSEDMAQFSVEKKGDWKWTLMIVQPDFITASQVETVIGQQKKKKPNPALSKVRLETFHEGFCVQIMHIGPFSAEGPTVEKVHGFIAQNGCKAAGKHHEIYLSDFQKTAPEKLKTIIRQPVIKT